jgi:hypothetical protein
MLKTTANAKLLAVMDKIVCGFRIDSEEKSRKTNRSYSRKTNNLTMRGIMSAYSHSGSRQTAE